MFSYGTWLRLPLSTRIRIANALGIAKTGSTHVQDNRIVSDGYKIEDVESAVNAAIDKGTPWELIVSEEVVVSAPTALAFVEDTGTVTISNPVETSPKKETKPKKKRGRPAKK